jgi:hypothetical protein
MLPILRRWLTAGFLAVVAHAAPPDVEFGGVTYKFAFVDVAADGTVTNEYVPLGETIEHWTTLLSVRHWPAAGFRDVATAWLKMLEPLLTRKVEAVKPTSARNDYDRIFEAWIAAPDKSYIEINLNHQIIEPRLPGVKSYQLAQKIMMPGGKGDPSPFLEKRATLYAEIEKLRLPLYKTAAALEVDVKDAKVELTKLRETNSDNMAIVKAKVRAIADLEKQRDMMTDFAATTPKR